MEGWTWQFLRYRLDFHDTKNVPWHKECSVAQRMFHGTKNVPWHKERSVAQRMFRGTKNVSWHKECSMEHWKFYGRLIVPWHIESYCTRVPNYSLFLMCFLKLTFGLVSDASLDFNVDFVYSKMEHKDTARWNINFLNLEPWNINQISSWRNSS